MPAFCLGLAACLSLICLLAFHAQPALAQRKLAFVVGINDYTRLEPQRQLKLAVNDANAVGDALAAIGFDVTRATGTVGLEALLSRFGAFVRTVGPGDTVVFFFAGHGISLDDGTYLIPSDVPVLSPGDELLAKRSTVAEREISQQIRGTGARAAIIVLDACRDNPFPKRGTRAIGQSTQGLTRLSAADGVFTLYSAREGQTAIDHLGAGDPARNSIFTRIFVETLKRPGVSLSELGESVRDEVAALARSVGHDQVPAVYNDLIGARGFFLGPAKPLPAKPLPAVEPPAPKPEETRPAQAGQPRERAAPAPVSYCERGDEYDSAIQSAGIDALRAYLQRCGGAGAYRAEAGREFESRLFAAAAECFRRSPGCRLDGCLGIYDGDLPDGPRRADLQAIARTVLRNRWSCRDKDARPENPPSQARPPEPAREPAGTPGWCGNAAAKNRVERAICADPRLGGLDIRLNLAYTERVNRLRGVGRAQFIKESRQWIRDRNAACDLDSAERVRDCLAAFTQDRIDRLAR